jgi:hypothetical protein
MISVHDFFEFRYEISHMISYTSRHDIMFSI